MKLLLRVLGGRVFWTFGLVAFLIAGLLAAVNLASRYALKSYVDGQLARTPWDMTVFQAEGSDARNPDVAKAIRSVPGITQIETMAILRAKLPPDSAVTLVDGKPLQTPWVTLIAASSPSLVPPQLMTLAESSGSARREVKPILALVGPESAMGAAFMALQGAREFSVAAKSQSRQQRIFATPINGVVRLDRDEFTRWMMDQTGSMSYVPPIGVVVLMPYDAAALASFDSLAQGILPADLMISGATAPAPGQDQLQHVQKSQYMPEVVYLGRIDRKRLISGWDMAASLRNVDLLADSVLRALAIFENTGALSSRNAPALAAVERSNGGLLHRLSTFFMPEASAASSAEPRILLAHQEESEKRLGGSAKRAELLPQASSLDDQSLHPSGYIVDSTTQVLLRQMQVMAHQIGLVSLLVALPLLWMGWMLSANLTGLLMLNERRKLGLMRLRGVPGRTLGRALIVSICTGGLLGGVLGISAGCILPLLVYENGRLPIEVLLQPRQVILLTLFLFVTITLSLLVSMRLVAYATSISPLEASGRYASSEAAVSRIEFGMPQAAALLLGGVGLAGWVFGFSLTGMIPLERIKGISLAFDFVSLPLFLYGLCTLLASRGALIQALMRPIQGRIGGRLGLLAQRHMAAKPHRSIAFLMIVALMASITLYPTVGSRSFEDKAARGAQVQIGSDWHFTFNAADLSSGNTLRGPVSKQVASVGSAMAHIAARARTLPGIESVDYMIEAFLPAFYLPGHGMHGVPLYLLANAHGYATNPYAEPELGASDSFEHIIRLVEKGGVALSPSVADFENAAVGAPLRIGADAQGNTISLPAAGTLAYLPGMPARSVTNRQGYVQARVDYLNHIFDNMAYLAVAADNPQVQNLDVFVPRTVLLVKVNPAVAADTAAAARVYRQLLHGFPATPLEIHTLPEEVRKVGNDMFVSLSLENMKIYLVGGIALALIAIFAIALANYTEDRRALALIRVRGASPRMLRRLLAAMLVSPSVLGLLLGGATALVAGYGLTNYVWTLREIRSVVQLLKTHLVLSELTGATAVFLLTVVVAAAWGFGKWSFRRSARENIRDA